MSETPVGRLRELGRLLGARKRRDKSKPQKTEQDKKEQRGSPDIRTIDAATLDGRDFPPLLWVVPEVLPEGLAILAGPPKTCKSWTALDIALAVSSGGKALGKIPVDQGVVLYLALEDGLRRIQERVRTICEEAKPQDLHFATSMENLDKGGYEQIARYIEEHKPKLLILDTFGRVRPGRKTNGALYDEDTRALAPLQVMATQKRLCILVIHHTRKAPGVDLVDEVSGSTGLTGVADLIAVMKRSRGTDGVTLFITGRDIEEKTLALSFDGGRLEYLGDAAEVGAGDRKKKMLACLDRMPMSPKDLADSIGIPQASCRKTLGELVAAGLARKRFDKKYERLTSELDSNLSDMCGLPTEQQTMENILDEF